MSPSKEKAKVGGVVPRVPGRGGGEPAFVSGRVCPSRRDARTGGGPRRPEVRTPVDTGTETFRRNTDRGFSRPSGLTLLRHLVETLSSCRPVRTEGWGVEDVGDWERYVHHPFDVGPES